MALFFDDKSDTQTKNYDENHLFVKNYEFFCINAFYIITLLFFILMPIVCINAKLHNEPTFFQMSSINYNNHHTYHSKATITFSAIMTLTDQFFGLFLGEMKDKPEVIIILNIIRYLFFIFVTLLFLYLLSLVYHENDDVMFGNKRVYFWQKGKYMSEEIIDKNEIYRSVFVFSGMSRIIKTFIFIMFLAYVYFLYFYFSNFYMPLFGIIIIYPALIATNFLVYCFLNKGDIRGFRIFTFLIIDRRSTFNSGEYATINPAIFLYNRKIYNELREYFLNTQNLDINKKIHLFF